MPAGGRLAYENELSPVGLTQGDLAASVYQGADPNALGEDGGCNCPCLDAAPMEPEFDPLAEAPVAGPAPAGTMDALFGMV